MLRIEHTLCVMPGVKLSDLKRVYSHPQALAQCSKFFAENPQIKAIPAFDTAGSAEELAERKAMDEGAIASAYAAKIYHLDVLKAGLENLKGTNFTRFYGIQKMPHDVDEVEGDAEKFANQRDKKIWAWWQNVLDKYGNPNSDTDKWVSSDNSYDPMMTAYYGELELVDCGRNAEDNSANIQSATDNFAAKSYAF
jgi:hypothetical protein